MKHRVTGRRPLALTAATTLALSGLFLGAPVAFADDSAEAPGQDAPIEVLNTRAELDKVGTDMVAVGQTADGGNVVVVTADSAASDAEISQIAATEGFPDASVVKVDRTLSAFAEGDVVGGQGYLSVAPDLPGFLAGEPDAAAWSCSLGFAAFSPAGDPALLSAGHCAFDEDGEPLSDTTLTVPSSEDAAGGTQTALPATIDLLGTFGFAQFGGADGGLGSNGETTATDISVIDIAPDSGWNLVPAVTDWSTAGDSLSSLADSVIDIKSVAAPVLGEVSKSGRTTGFTTGTVDGDDILDGWAPIDGHWVRGFSSNTLAGPGDSGGAVIQGNAAVGLISGGTEATETEEQFTWAASLVTALPQTGGYEVALDLDAPVITSPTDGAEVQPGTAITGTAPGAEKVTVSGFGADQTVRVVDGAFSVVGPVELGEQTISVRARTGFSSSETVTLDVKVVPAPLVAPVITSPADGSTVNETVTAISGTGLPTTAITVTDAQTDDVLGTTEVAADGSWTVDGLTLEYGSHSVVVTQTRTIDGEDEVSPEATSAFSVIPVSPAVTSVANGAEFAHNDGPSGLAGSGIDGATVTVKLTGAEPTTANTAALAGAFAAASGTFTATVEDGAWSVDFGAALESGTYTVSATQAIDGVSSAPTDLAFAVLAAPVAGGGGAAPAPGEGGAAAPGDGGLAATGSDMLVPLTAGAIALALLSGGLLLVVRRRQQIQS
ncbi:LPXTG cell wall anchor domain-containing protein [uncultured Microbacterium sp.]|uniref:LPXTG cell wall anchor domain-containing protein n=1 Tax=uncultured Microbacterium sp. TaxID=191216 RepID=UPI0025ED45BA|nr:LPXTG cell wall anchor domain-containing protein [uncultured Microbacterium sp.]